MRTRPAGAERGGQRRKDGAAAAPAISDAFNIKDRLFPDFVLTFFPIVSDIFPDFVFIRLRFTFTNSQSTFTSLQPPFTHSQLTSYEFATLHSQIWGLGF